MRLQFRCLPELEPHLPRPKLAAEGLPDWLKRMPAEVKSALLGAKVRSVKQCPPFLDALRHGVLMPLAAELRFEGGSFAWDSDLPLLERSRLSRSPLGVHLPEQLAGAPFAEPSHFAVKFTNFWSVTLPEGWAMLFTHPLNREELPFRTLTGRVDCDRFAGGFVHFPALWTDPGFEGSLPKGTPVAQAFPVPREALELDFGVFDETGLARHLEVQEALKADPGAYRKRYRAE